jgi:hypothetical protein
MSAKRDIIYFKAFNYTLLRDRANPPEVWRCL